MMHDEDIDRLIAQGRHPIQSGDRSFWQGLTVNQNVAANGRWGTLAMAAIALHQGSALLAFVFVLTLFFSYVVEQIPMYWPGRKLLAALIVAWTIGALLALLFVILA